MLLAALMDLHPDELRADLQRHYGVDIDHAMAGEHSAAHVAALVANLPLDARVYVAHDKDASWTREEIILAEIRNALHSLIYGMSDKRKRGKAPDPIGPSWMTEKSTRRLESRALDIPELLEELNKPRRC